MHDETSPRAAGPMREAIEQLAAEILARSAVTRPPVDIDAVAEAEDLRFVPIAFPTGALGMYVREMDVTYRHLRTPFAWIGSRQHPLSQRFTKAHELAHHLIDEPPRWVADLGLALPQWPSDPVRRRGYHEWHEAFAASLLMPRRWVDRFDGGSWTRRDVARLARRFAVTTIAAAARLEELHRGPRHDIVPASVPAGELTGMYAQA
jgi:Zn-dependent peptidase ImmA (M78 family)